MGVYLISDGSEYPWRAKLRGPSFVNLQVLPELLRGYKMSDVIAVLGGLDFVVGEVDRQAMKLLTCPSRWAVTLHAPTASIG